MSNEVVDLGWILVEFNTKQKIKKTTKGVMPRSAFGLFFNVA